MKTTEPNINRIKNHWMYVLTFILSVLFTLNTTAEINKNSNVLDDNLNSEQQMLEAIIFANVLDFSSENLNISDIEVIEIEEDVVIGFDTSNHLPENFNPLKGKHDLDWNTIELIEIEEDVELGFDTSNHLPENFNALKGKHDLDWNTIELIEIEEEVELGYDTSNYLPENFNPLKGKHDLDWNSIEIIEIEEDIEINFNTKAYLPANFDPYEGMHKKEVQVCSQL